MIPAAEGIYKSRRARDTTLSVPLEANIHTECRFCALRPPYRTTETITILVEGTLPGFGFGFCPAHLGLISPSLSMAASQPPPQGSGNIA